MDTLKDLTHRDCTNCLECADSCPEAGALRLQASGWTLRKPKLVLAALAILTLTGGYHLRAAFTQPTTVASFSGKPVAQAVFIVDGLKCKGTAYLFTDLYKEVPGIAGIETFASEHRAVFTYDPELITPDGIRAVMEAPIDFEDGSTVKVFSARIQP